MASEVPVEEGDVVKRGDVLVRLDATLAELEAQTAAAARRRVLYNGSLLSLLDDVG